jgi:prolyl-tRNA editing enzyme YbaK/EbsC (Cys-tRNA(Pro) deacylase)
MSFWPEPVERVAAVIRAAGVDARVEELLGGTSTAAEAAKRIGCDLGTIVKSLVFDCGGRSVLVLVPGDRRADARKVADAVGVPAARVAGSEQVEAATGCEPGAVAPFPVREVDRVLAERSLLLHEVVWIGAGSPRHMAALTPTDLLRLARAEPRDVVEAD